MANLNTARSWSVIWDKIQGFFGFSGVESPFTSGPAVIDSPVTIYVETTGNDRNPGTQDRPFRTIQAALDYLKPFEINSTVTVQVGAGTFDGFALTIQGQYNRLAGTSELVIAGTTTTLDSGTLTGQSKTNFLLTITDSSKSWTVNQFADKFVDFVISGSTLRYPIVSNTATTLTFATGLSSISVSEYRISDNSTIISGTTGPFIVGSASSRTGIEVSNNCPFEAATRIESVTVTASAIGRAVDASSSQSGVQFKFCKMIGTGIGSVISVTAGGLSMDSCLVDAGGGSGGGIVMSASGKRSRSLSLFNGYIKNATGASSGIFLGQGSNNLVNTSFVSNCLVGITIQDGAGCVLSAEISNCTTAIIARNRANVSNGSTGGAGLYGSGNTTAIQCDTGAMIRVLAASNITGTNEISVDGVTSTLATMRGNTPKVFPLTSNPYGSFVSQ